LKNYKISPFCISRILIDNIIKKARVAGFYAFNKICLNYKLATITNMETKPANNPQMVIWAASKRRLLVGWVRLFFIEFVSLFVDWSGYCLSYALLIH
jgi:hypothetical protein